MDNFKANCTLDSQDTFRASLVEDSYGSAELFVEVTWPLRHEGLGVYLSAPDMCRLRDYLIACLGEPTTASPTDRWADAAMDAG